jgi:hypothetical protein
MTLSVNEMNLLHRACATLGPGPDYRCSDFIYNIVLTALDFQMDAEKVATRSADTFRTRYEKVKNLAELKSLLKRHPNTKRGNLKLSQELWSNNHWSRIKFLRVLVDELEKRKVKGQRSLVRWLKKVRDFDDEIKGQFRTTGGPPVHSMGLAIFSWLQLRCGLPVVKPDRRVLNFVSNAIGRKANSKEAKDALYLIAKRLRRKPYSLDSAIWHHDKEASVAARAT